MKISIITVCLNPGESLNFTMDSIIKQQYTDYEVLIKDGGSTDNSLENIPADSRFRLISGKDKGIYDAMNIALGQITGDTVIFMNCGDSFYDDSVLERIALAESEQKLKAQFIIYGDIFSKLAGTVVKSPSRITPKVCYNQIPCHQATVYSADLFQERAFDTAYRIRADYEHFLYCYFEKHTDFVYMDYPVCVYEGGGFSESRKNRKSARKEHSLIVKKYIPFNVRFSQKLRLIITLQPLREKMAKSKAFGTVYEKIRRMIKK